MLHFVVATLPEPIQVLVGQNEQAMISLHRMADKGLIGEFCFFLFSLFRSYMMTHFFKGEMCQI